MSQTFHADVQNYGEPILADLQTLQQRIVEAWQDRAVILTRDEQRRLRAQVKETCEFLTDLTAEG